MSQIRWALCLWLCIQLLEYHFNNLLLETAFHLTSRWITDLNANKITKTKITKTTMPANTGYFAVPEPMLEHSQFHGPCNWCHLCLTLFPQITYMAWSLLLRTECLCPSKIRCWSLFLNVMVLESGALWGYLSHEGRVLMNGISEWDQCPYKKKRESWSLFFPLSLPCGHSKKVSVNQGEGLHKEPNGQHIIVLATQTMVF